MSGKFGGATEICPVCTEKVYAMDRFVIEKMVIHKACFKQVYCKTHYLQLFRESGGRYDKAFGDGGFERTSTEVGYTPGQFKGIGAKPSAPAGVSGIKVKEVMKKFQDISNPTTAPAPPKPEVLKKPVVEEEAPSSVSDRKSAYLAAVGGGGGAGGGGGSLNSSFESSPSNSPSSASFRSSADRKNAYLAAMAQTNGTAKPTLDTSTGMSVSQRIKNYSSTASSLKEPDVAAPPPPSKLADRLQQYVSNAQAGITTKEDENKETNESESFSYHKEDEEEQQQEEEQQLQQEEEEDGQVA
ncbi:hypothetical protein BASA81_004051 [Batrachochytrium salamandrivorans]|nr:hypothetical protein BASA81_004051 [Batrachochytrium salamandrivorans]